MKALAFLRIGIVIVLASIVLIACVSNQATQIGSAPSPTFSTQTKNCGKVQTGPQGNLLDEITVKKVIDCFWQAFQQCNSASLVFTASGGDTATIRTFTIEKNKSQCLISDAAQDVMGPNTPTPAKTYICKNLQQKQDGLHFTSCGEDGDVLVPAGTTH